MIQHAFSKPSLVNLISKDAKLLIYSSVSFSAAGKYVLEYCKLYLYRILGECLLISSLLGKALRKHVDTARLAKRFNMRS